VVLYLENEEPREVQETCEKWYDKRKTKAESKKSKEGEAKEQ